MKRWLAAVAVLLGVGAVARKIVGSRAGELHGLTESEVRQKLEQRLPNRVPDDKRAAIADRVVATMKDRGALADEEEPSPAPGSEATAPAPESEAGAAAPVEEPEPDASPPETDDDEPPGNS